MTTPPTGRKYDLDRVVRLVLSVVSVVGLFLLVRYLADVLIPFAAAVLLAYVLNPLVVWVDRRIRNRTASVLLTVGGAAILFLGFIAILIPLIYAQASDVVRILGYREAIDLIQQVSVDSTDPSVGTGATPFERLLPPAPLSPPATAPAPMDSATSAPATQPEEPDWWVQFHHYREQQAGRWRAFLDKIALVPQEDVKQAVLALAKKLAPGAWGALTGVIKILVGLAGLVVVFLYIVFLLMDYPEYRKQWRELLPPEHREWIVEFLYAFNTAMSRYFRGQLVIAAFGGAFFAVGFWLIGLKMGILLGLVVGALTMVPYLQIVGFFPALFLAVVRAVEARQPIWWYMMWVCVVFLVVQLIQDWVLTPRIQGKSTGLKPVAILLGVFIWGKLLGFLGVLLAIPLTCVGLAYYNRFVLNRGPRALVEAGLQEAPPRKGPGRKGK